MSDAPPTKAMFKPSRWPGLIWAVPVAALGIVAWLGIQALLSSGPTVTVEFPVIAAIKAGSTEVHFQGLTVGEVKAVRLGGDMNRMAVELELDHRMSGHLGPGTRYWIAGTSLDWSNLGEVKAMISGPFIGIDPKPGKTVGRVEGLGEPPVIQRPEAGESIVLHTDALSQVSRGSPVLYRGFRVGRVTQIDLEPGGKRFSITIFIPRERQNLITENTRFWDSGSVQVSTGGAGLGVRMASLPALFTGAVAFETPDGPPAPQARPGAAYRLYSSEQAARSAPGPGAVAFRVEFPGGPRGLEAGAPVRLEGALAGVVTRVALQCDAHRGTVTTRVDLAVEPYRLGLVGETWDLRDPRPQVERLMAVLVAHGLRAELGSSVPVVGGKEVELAVVPGQRPAALLPGKPPEIPAIAGAGGVGEIFTRVNEILAKINALPLEQIGANVHEATWRLARVARDPETRAALQRLDATVTHVEDLTRQADAKAPAILNEVQASAAAAQAAMEHIQAAIAASSAANPGSKSADLDQTLYEITQAARSLRELTDFLNTHPNALLFGRKE